MPLQNKNRKEYVGTKCAGNHCFEGYAMDLIDEISKILHFKYEFRLVPNNAYGSYNKETKKWDGLVKELLDHVSSSPYSHYTALD